METNELFNYDLGLTLPLSDHQSEIPTTDQSHQSHWRVPPPNPKFCENNSDAESNEDVGNLDSDFIPSEEENEDGGPIPGPEQKRKRGRPPNSKNKATLARDSNTKTASNICKICNKSFTAITSLRRHELTHSENNQRFTCEDCGKKFTQKPSLVTHIKTQHLGELNFPCGHCDKIYVRNCELQAHIRRCHQLGPKFRQKCPECKNEYVNLKKHFRETHQRRPKELKHKCSICDKCFAHPYELTRHVKVHNKTNEDLFPCPHCPVKCLMKSQLVTHISRTHLIERTIVSKYCGMKFKYYNARNYHDEIHKTKGICSKTGLSRRKFFACEFCPERTESEYLLKLHMTKTHPEPRLILKKLMVKNISLKENPDSGLFLVRSEKEAKDSGSVCAWHLCLKCGTAFSDLNRARRHNNFCEVVPQHLNSINNLNKPTIAMVSAENENRNPDRDREIDPPLTLSEPVSRPVKTEISLGQSEPVPPMAAEPSSSRTPTPFFPVLGQKKKSDSDFCEVMPDNLKSDENPKKPATVTMTSEIKDTNNSSTDGDPGIPDHEPPLTSSDSISTPVETEIINSDDDDDFEGVAFEEDDLTDMILNSAIDADGPYLTTPSTIHLKISETRDHLGNSFMVEDGGQLETCHSEPPSLTPTPDKSDKPATPETPMPAPSMPGPAEKKKSKLPAALRATTPWQEKHMNVVLSAPKPFQCKTCLQFYSSKTGLLIHVKVHAEPEHCCEYCGKRFSKRQLWIYHVRTHTGEKPHKCKFCDHRTVTPMEIRQHERIHDKTEDGARKKPKMTEHMKKMCTCTVCKKLFTSAFQCRDHVYFQHEYDPKNGKGLPCTCTICKKTFAYKSNANAHVKSAHPDEFEEARGRLENPSKIRRSNIYANLISVDKSLLAPKSVNPAQGRRERPDSGEESDDDSNFEDLSSLISQ